MKIELNWKLLLTHMFLRDPIVINISFLSSCFDSFTFRFNVPFLFTKRNEQLLNSYNHQNYHSCQKDIEKKSVEKIKSSSGLICKLIYLRFSVQTFIRFSYGYCLVKDGILIYFSILKKRNLKLVPCNSFNKKMKRWFTLPPCSYKTVYWNNSLPLLKGLLTQLLFNVPHPCIWD